jgi:hypothetical protein
MDLARQAASLPRFEAFSQGTQRLIAGWSSPVARQAHNLKVASSNLAPATKPFFQVGDLEGFFWSCCGQRHANNAFAKILRRPLTYLKSATAIRD